MIGDPSRLARMLGHSFSHPDLLVQALTHRSAPGISNERLEFLGDALLGFVIAEALWRLLPEAHEGELSRTRASLVKKEALARRARHIKLGDYLRLGPGESRTGAHGRDSILEDALEAVFGAVYLEQRLIVRSELGDMLPQDVGVGISQLLPIAVALLSSNNRPIALEQPELHVHPRLQAKIADLLIEASTAPNDKLIFVETHSEHLILRLLRRIRETTENELPDWHPGLTCTQLAVIYLAGGQERTTAVSLRVTDDGDFLDRWPNGFFEERAEELF